MSTPALLSLHRALTATLILFGFGSVAQAANTIDTRSQQIWKLKYGVADAQLYNGGIQDNGLNATWLAGDADGDGLTNATELGAGTNPFSAASAVRITSIVGFTTTVDITFPTEIGKQYVVQGAPNLTTAFADLSPAVTWTGTGSPKTLTSVPKGTNKYFRIIVRDIDTDGDAVSNWAELAVTLNPNAGQTVTGTNDVSYVDAQIALPNVVTITASTPFASEDGPSAGKFTVSRTQNLFPITVNYTVSGTAVPSPAPGADYAALSTPSVAFAARGATTQDIFVNPTVQAPTIKGGRSVTATLTPAGAVSFPFTLGTPNDKATVIINSSTVAAGTGLLGRYYDTASATQADAANFGQAGMYTFTRGTPTTSGTIIVTYSGTTIPGLVAVPSGIGASQVKVSFTSGSLNNALYNNLSFPVTAMTANTFTLSITAAAAFGFTSTNGNCNFNIQSFTHPPTFTRLDSTVNFDWQHGTPNGNVIAPNNSPDNYSATWDAYLQPTTAGNYIFQLDADDKARVLIDLDNNGTFDLPGEQIVEHNWVVPATIGTFKQSASIPLLVPGTPAQRYHIRVEHVETTGDARCRLQWNVNGGGFVNIPQANQFTHTQALSYVYSAATGTAIVTPSGGHTFNVNDTVPLAFSTGVLFTPGAASSYNGNYTVTAVGGNSGTITVAGATTTAASPIITVPSTAGLAVGMAVSGTGLPGNEYITAIGSGQITVTTGTGVTAQASTTLTFSSNITVAIGTPGVPVAINGAATAANSATITVPSTAGLVVGMAVSGTGLPANEFITSIGTTTITVTTGTGVTAQASTNLTAVLKGFSVPINGATTAAGSPNILVPSTTGLATGMLVSGTGLPANELITAITPSASGPGLISVTTGTGVTAQASTNLTAVLPTTGTTTGSGFVLSVPTPPNTPSPQTGLYILAYGNTGFAGSPGRVGVDAAVTTGNNGLWNSGTPDVASIQPETFSARWTGQVQPQFSEDYTFVVQADDGCALWINGQPQVLKMSPSANTGGNTYTYDSATGNLVVTYSGLIAVANSFVVGETVRIEPSAGTLNHAPSVSPTYNYDGSTGIAVITYSALTNVTQGGFVAHDKIELDPTSGSVNLGNVLYEILESPAPTATTFAVNLGTGVFVSGTGNITINDFQNVPITAATATTFTVNIGTGKYASQAAAANINVDIANKALKDWSNNGNERYVRISLVGGVRYDIQLDAYETTGAARSILSWFSASQPKQVIPAERLYPSSVSQAPPSHIAATTGTALVNGPFSYAVAGSNGGAVSVTGLPSGLIYAGGVISGTPAVAGDYQVVITITNAAGTTTSVLNLHIEQNGGNVVRETWNVAGTSVSDIPTGTTPTGPSTILTSLQGPTNAGDNYGARIRGYITAPTTGNYYFWIAANNAAELWISNNAEQVEAQKRAWITTGSTTPLSWNDSLTQKSPWLALEAGQKYYFEILHKAGGAGAGTDNLAVGWLKPGETGTVPSEIVPSYVLSPFTVLVPLAPGSTVYASILRPQNNLVVTNASGSSFIRLNAAETEANITVKYSGLSSLYSGMHVHDDLIPNPVGGLDNVIADFDQPGEVPQQPDGTYKWVIQPRGAYSVAQLVDHLKTGHIYFNVHSVNYPGGEIKGFYSKVDGSQTFTAPAAPLTWTDDSNTSDGASRFLSQVTFGANPADIAALKALSATGAVPASGIPANRYSTWIDNQFLITPPTQHLPEVLAREIADVFGPFDVRVYFNTWWKSSMTAPDQLRQRVAFALSEIHVVSGDGPLEDNSRAMADFYDTLAANAFGNFRDILVGTTLTPAMGRYLDMLRNDKPDLAIGRSPNENYAREIKQLFSIGLYRMWPDGTLILNSQYEPVDTYTQREIVGLAHVFTGWDYGYDGDDHTALNALTDWTRPMRDVPARHFTGNKRVLNNEVLPGLPTLGGQPLDPYATHLSSQYYDNAYRTLPAQELDEVHDMLFNHPNTGPFICRQLIQRLVTSNPSKEYVYRVVQKFNDNGSGIRGDMRAVIKAILLDYEARSSAMLTNIGFGKQREPIQRVTDAARAFRPANAGGTYTQTGGPTIKVTMPNQFVTDNSVFLEFTDATTPSAQPAPTTGTYRVLGTASTPPAPANPTATDFYIPAPGWLYGTYNQVGGSTVMTIAMANHWLPGDNANVIPTAQVLPAPNKGQAYFDFITGSAANLAGLDKTIQTVTTSASYDIPSGVGNSATAPSINGNVAGQTFTITRPDTTARSGTVMISRFGGSYSSTGRAGVITIDTFYGGAGTYGTMADHGLSVGDTVFINFANSRDTTSGDPTSTDNDLVYTIASVPDPNTFTVAAVNAANAAMNSDNQAFVFPLKEQPLTRNGTVNARPSTFTMDDTDGDLQQTPLNSPTVFNYFLPDYKFAGPLANQGMTTPEFQLTSETTVIRQANFMYAGVFGSATATTGTSSFKTGSNALVLDLTPWMGTAVNTPGSIGFILGNGGLGSGQNIAQVWTSNANLPTLIDRLTTLLLPGQLSTAAKTHILNFVGRQITGITVSNPCVINMGTPHGLATGDSVTISGVGGGTFQLVSNSSATSVNGTFTITVPAGPNPTTFTISTIKCTNASGLTYTDSAAGIISTSSSERIRAAVHLILTSPDFTIQR